MLLVVSQTQAEKEERKGCVIVVGESSFEQWPIALGEEEGTCLVGEMANSDWGGLTNPRSKEECKRGRKEKDVKREGNMFKERDFCFK